MAMNGRESQGTAPMKQVVTLLRILPAALLVLAAWLPAPAEERPLTPPPAPLNLAKGKAATASSTQGDEHAADKACDGDAGTRWCASDGSVPQWWQVDLGEVCDLGGCQISWEQSAAYGYTVKGSPDGQQWVVLARSAAGRSDQLREHAFAARVRYLRIDIDTLEEGKWASIFEVAVFAPR
jgi:hypothetical protein